MLESFQTRPCGYILYNVFCDMIDSQLYKRALRAGVGLLERIVTSTYTFCQEKLHKSYEASLQKVQSAKQVHTI